MKIKFRTLAAVLAASLALVSCSRDSGFENTITQPTISAARVITVSFSGNSTKTNPGTDGLTPKFSDGDVIKVANGTDAPQDCAVSVKGDEATISTTLSGALTAVYPAAAAKMSGNAIEGILVPTVQDGTFASANISLASVAANATEATFENQTAVFKITPGAGANAKYVEVVTVDYEIANSVPAGGTYTSLHKIHVNSKAANPVYVSILVSEGLNLNALTFADNSGVKTPTSSDAVVVSKLYTVTGENWGHH